MQAHERKESTRRWRGRRRMVEKKCRETHCFLAQISSHRRLGGRTVVALVEEKVKGTLYGQQAHGQVVRAQHIEKLPRSCQHLFCPSNALLHGVVAANERCGDLIHTETAQDVQHERDLGFLGEAGMAAREHHVKLSVRDGMCLEKLLYGGRKRPFTIERSS